QRCDGARPICGPCARAEEPECEYTDSGPAASQILEREVADLEARIRVLEGRTSDSITLHDPHAACRGRSTGPGTTRYSENPVEQLLYVFQRCHGLCFFLNVPRFVRRLSAGRSAANGVLPSLAYAIQLLGLQFVDDPHLKAGEARLLERALQAIGAATSDLEPHKVIDTLQAELLVSLYFFSKDRKLEGGYHLTAAVSIAVGCNLHKLRDPGTSANASALVNARHRLAPPADDIEAGERILGFWILYTLDRCWSVVLKSQSVLTQSYSSIDTPWPLDMSNYERLAQSLAHGNTQTVKTFLMNTNSTGWDRSLLALCAQAATLYERAADMASKWKPLAPSFQSAFLSVDNRIEHFKQNLPPLPTSDSAGSDTRTLPTAAELSVHRCLLIIHTLSHSATIQLHTPLQQDHDPMNSRALASAIAAANLLQGVDVRGFGFVDPVLGSLWATIAQVLLRGLVNLRRLRIRAASGSRGATHPAANLPGELMVTSALDSIQIAMEGLGGTSLLIGT
ncbi:hypothetical protein K474DRAFT_1593666, partial [Panus rudis PR-1116 ss-1]